MENESRLTLEEVFVGNKFTHNTNAELYTVTKVDRKHDQVTLVNRSGAYFKDSERILRLNWTRVPGPPIVRCTPENLSIGDIVFYTLDKVIRNNENPAQVVRKIDTDGEQVTVLNSEGYDHYIGFDLLEGWVKEESARHFPHALIGRQWVSDRDQTIARITNIRDNTVKLFLDDAPSLRVNYPAPTFDFEFRELFRSNPTWTVEEFFALWRPCVNREPRFVYETRVWE